MKTLWNTLIITLTILAIVLILIGAYLTTIAAFFKGGIEHTLVGLCMIAMGCMIIMAELPSITPVIGEIVIRIKERQDQ